MLGRHPPRAARARNVEDGVDDMALLISRIGHARGRPVRAALGERVRSTPIPRPSDRSCSADGLAFRGPSVLLCWARVAGVHIARLREGFEHPRGTSRTPATLPFVTSEPDVTSVAAPSRATGTIGPATSSIAGASCPEVRAKSRTIDRAASSTPSGPFGARRATCSTPSSDFRVRDSSSRIASMRCGRSAIRCNAVAPAAITPSTTAPNGSIDPSPSSSNCTERTAAGRSRPASKMRRHSSAARAPNSRASRTVMGPVDTRR